MAFIAFLHSLNNQAHKEIKEAESIGTTKLRIREYCKTQPIRKQEQIISDTGGKSNRKAQEKPDHQDHGLDTTL